MLMPLSILEAGAACNGAILEKSLLHETAETTKAAILSGLSNDADFPDDPVEVLGRTSGLSRSQSRLGFRTGLPGIFLPANNSRKIGSNVKQVTAFA